MNEAKKMQLILQLTRDTRDSKTISTLEYSLNTNNKAVYKSMPRTTARYKRLRDKIMGK